MQGKQLRKLEVELWRAADQFRANRKLTASEYSMPVLGLMFSRHAYNRFQKVKIEVVKTLPSHPQRGKRPLTKKDVEGLCKVVTQAEIEAKDWSLSPGRYVGVDVATDEDFDYEERLNELHIELQGLNEEAITLARTISENYKDLAL
jgi:type I restriction-modification system DNA methylase subunit